mgnify:CR=1 FL=1
MPKGAVLVCVTAQKSSHLLIRRGAELARREALPLLVLFVCGSGPNLLEMPGVSEMLDDLYRASCAEGAEMTMLTSPDPRSAIRSFAQERHATHLVMGQGVPSPHGLAAQLASDLPEVHIHTELTECMPEMAAL